MPRRVLAFVLVCAMSLAAPVSAAPMRGRQAAIGQISGNAVVEGKPLANITVRLRSVDNGQVVSTSTTNATGGFSVGNLPAGNYVVETVGPNNILLGTSPRIALSPGAMTASGVTVSTSAAAASAAGLGVSATGAGAGASAGGAAPPLATGASSAGAAAGAAGTGGAFFATTAGIVTTIAIGAGVAGAVVAVRNDASPSR